MAALSLGNSAPGNSPAPASVPVFLPLSATSPVEPVEPGVPGAGCPGMGLPGEGRLGPLAPGELLDELSEESLEDLPLDELLDGLLDGLLLDELLGEPDGNEGREAEGGCGMEGVDGELLPTQPVIARHNAATNITAGCGDVCTALAMLVFLIYRYCKSLAYLFGIYRCISIKTRSERDCTQLSHQSPHFSFWFFSGLDLYNI